MTKVCPATPVSVILISPLERRCGGDNCGRGRLSIVVKIRLVLPNAGSRKKPPPRSRPEMLLNEPVCEAYLMISNVSPPLGRNPFTSEMLSGFRPSGGDTFEIIKYASHTGSFNNISGLDLGGGFFLEPAFGSTNLILTTIDNRPRPQLSPPQRLPNGEIRITLTGVAGQTFVIQATTNLVSWDAVLTNVNSGAVFDLIITDSSLYPYRFYRTFQP